MESFIVVDAPPPFVLLKEHEPAGNALLNFYEALGWNKTDLLDPTKVVTTKAVFDSIYNAMREKCDDYVGVSMLMANNGPSVDKRVPEDKVVLKQGWVKPENSE